MLHQLTETHIITEEPQNIALLHNADTIFRHVFLILLLFNLYMSEYPCRLSNQSYACKNNPIHISVSKKQLEETPRRAPITLKGCACSLEKLHSHSKQLLKQPDILVTSSDTV